jgi:hypothetical protein
MNTRTKTILMAVALSAAATALTSQAADQGASFEEQMERTDGYSSVADFVLTPSRLKPATAHQIAEDDWLTAERARGPGSLPTPFPVSPSNFVASPARLKPATAYQIAEDNWLTAERARGPGSLPTPFPVPGTSVAAKAAPVESVHVVTGK